jgi:PPK2 family polyphosphate:nucleotide phosphotransferase
VKLSEIDPANTHGVAKEHAEEVMVTDLERLRDLQERFYVDGRRALLLVLQGMDTSGKDGMVRHLSGGINLLSSQVTAFKQPSGAELQHDYLWRVHQRVPALAIFGIFNRSHYEDVLVPRVHKLVAPDAWRARFRQINDFERLLVENRTVVIKCFLHISKQEQKERLQARLDDRAKLWKFDPADISERAFWDEYQRAYEEVLAECSTEAAPWYVIPADHKWYRNYAVPRLLIETLELLDLRVPEPKFDPSTIRLE